MNKQTLREKILTYRATHPDPQSDQQIIQYFLESDLYKNANWVMLYLSFGSEIDTISLAKQILKDHKHLVVPVCHHTAPYLLPCEVHHFPDDLEKSDYGLLEVKASLRQPLPVDTLDCVVVPGMAFTAAGYRIGFGGGYYDRFLPTLNCPTVSFVRSDFILPSLPLEAHDRAVDYLITENGFLEAASVEVSHEH